LCRRGHLLGVRQAAVAVEGGELEDTTIDLEGLEDDIDYEGDDRDTEQVVDDWTDFDD